MNNEQTFESKDSTEKKFDTYGFPIPGSEFSFSEEEFISLAKKMRNNPKVEMIQNQLAQIIEGQAEISSNLVQEIIQKLQCIIEYLRGYDGINYDDIGLPLPKGEYPFTNEKIGAKIRERRKELGLTQEQVGKTLDKSDSTLSKIENGETIIDSVFIKKIARILNCTPQYLVGASDLVDGTGIEGMKDQISENRAAILMIDPSEADVINLLQLRYHLDPELYWLFAKAFKESDKNRKKIRRILEILLE